MFDELTKVFSERDRQMKKYPKTAKYNSNWIEQNWMGPNPLWLLEDLCGYMELHPGMKVLDMGCGKGIRRDRLR